jgi:hypothetical protein
LICFGPALDVFNMLKFLAAVNRVEDFRNAPSRRRTVDLPGYFFRTVHFRLDVSGAGAVASFWWGCLIFEIEEASMLRSWLSSATTFAVLMLAAGSAWAGAGGPCGTGTPHALPEPTALALLGVGVAGIAAFRRRRNRGK